MRNVNYQQTAYQEENTPLVTILETRMDTKESTAIDSRKATYVIDLIKASFGGITYPEVGSQWYIKKISGIWTLMARATFQNPQLNPAHDPGIGDTLVGNGGTVYLLNDVVIKGDVTIEGDATVDGSLTVGEGDDPDLAAIRIWPTNTAPDNWMLCDGSAISRTTYSDLFDIIGTTYGVGDGSSTFNIPNLKGKVVVGRDSGQTEFDVLAETGGAKTHTLSTSEIPSHTHGVTGVTVATQSANHTHTFSDTSSSDAHTHTIGADQDVPSGSANYSVHRGSGSGGFQSNASTSDSHSHTVSGTTGNQSASHTHSLSGSTDSAGTGGSHNNLQPYIVLNFIIKVTPSLDGGGGGGGGGGASALDDLTDVVISSPTTNQVLKYNGSVWVNDTATGGATTLDDLTDVVISAAGDRQIIQHNGVSWSNRADLLLVESTTGTAAISMKVGGDSQERLIAYANGKLAWGSGSATQDTNLYRNGAGILKTDGSIQMDAGQTIDVGGATGTASFTTKRASSTDSAFSARVTGDSVSRYVVDASGSITWGPGSGAVDTNLYRSAANVLKTDDALIVTGAFSVGSGPVEIDPSSPVTAEVLRYDGSKFVSEGLVESDISGLSTDLAAKQARSTLTTKGDLYIATASATTTRLGVGADGTVLYADSGQTEGARWKALAESDITGLVSDLAGKQPLATLTTKGDIYVATGAGTVVRLGVGSDSHVLTADSAQTSGVKWAASSGGGGGTTLSALTDVSISGIADRNVFQYEGASSLWKNRKSILLEQALSSDAAINSRVASDTQERFIMGADGKFNWGSGSAAQDVNLYRSAANILMTDDEFWVNSASSSTKSFVAQVTGDSVQRFDVLATGKIEWGSGSGAVDTNLYRNGTNILKTDGSLQMVDGQTIDVGGSSSASSFTTKRASSTDLALSAFVSGDTVNRFNIDAAGKHSWGAGGSSAVDVNLYRSAANVLKTDDAFVAAGGLTIKTLEVDTASAVTNQVLRYNGTKFLPMNSGPEIYTCTSQLDVTTTGLSDIPGLTFSVVSGEVYYVVALIACTGTTAGDLRFDWDFTGMVSADMRRWTLGLALGTTTNQDSNVTMARRDGGTDVGVGGDAGTGSGSTAYTEHIIIEPSASGTVKMRAGQNAASGTSSVFTQSRLVVFRSIAAP